jgi:hypothetical protein
MKECIEDFRQFKAGESKQMDVTAWYMHDKIKMVAIADNCATIAQICRQLTHYAYPTIMGRTRWTAQNLKCIYARIDGFEQELHAICEKNKRTMQ